MFDPTIMKNIYGWCLTNKQLLLFDELKELEAQPTWVLNQLIKKNIAWQDINAGHSGAEKLVEQKLHDEMLQKPQGQQLGMQSTTQLHASSQSSASQSWLTEIATDSQRSTPAERQLHFRSQDPELPPLKMP
ncbi:unnamed protein product [Enterobius vermicularis]|uniref:ABC transporter ATP-binding protein n=1 Tax=Enterobius vermicularis TaxID=51028 RepID=A0A0N4V323_ENTVE|nr:unnamed protein product [Enterobius vermicularis]